MGERFDRLTEQLHILTGLWTTPVGKTFDYAGAHYTISDSPALPKTRSLAVPADHHRRWWRQADTGIGGAVRGGVQQAVRST
jgi:alkanesulfonate monooxygenase SsuD/methylene tetrahydromethanopterin reductase-like flavin-dependent oxidoreductase (luciferase family)